MACPPSASGETGFEGAEKSAALFEKRNKWHCKPFAIPFRETARAIACTPDGAAQPDSTPGFVAPTGPMHCTPEQTPPAKPANA